MRMLSNAIVIVLLSVLTGRAQVYPAWFLNAPLTECAQATAGIANAVYFNNSSALAYQDGLNRIARHRYTAIAGDQQFWKTEVGNAATGAVYVEWYDTSAVAEAAVTYAVVDSFRTGNLSLVLLAPDGCGSDAIDTSRTDITLRPPPDWLNGVSEDSRFRYEVGVSDANYYEASSWLRAEKEARRALARAGNNTIEAEQRVENSQGEEQQKSSFVVTLKNLKVTARYVDVQNGLFYVLMRTEK